jgi:hypothetical protein
MTFIEVKQAGSAKDNAATLNALLCNAPRQCRTRPTLEPSPRPAPISTTMAAIQAAAGFAQVANMLKATKSSSGGSGVGASAAPGQAPGGAQSAQAGVQQSLLVQGISSDQLFTGDVVRGLAEQLLDFQRGGGRVVLA